MSYICKFCGRESQRLCDHTRHQNACKLNPQRKSYIGNKIKCLYCGKEFSIHGIHHHIDITHLKKRLSNYKVWNKGLTKETDERIKKQNQTYRKNYDAGLIDNGWKGKHHKESSKQKLSIARKKYLKTNQHNWSKYHNKESDPEKQFRMFVERNNFNIKQYYIPKGERYFELDFADINNKIGFEINGNQHYDKNGNLLEYYQNRHNYFESNRWKILEIHYLLCYHEEILKDIFSNIYIDINHCIDFVENKTKEIMNASVA